MINLSSTTDKIQVVLDSAVTSSELSCYAAYRDTTTTSISPINNQMLTTGATAVDLVPSPAVSTQRLVEYLSVHNRDTQPREVTVRFSDNGTLYTLFKCRIQPGDKLEFKDKRGFEVVTKSGSIRKTETFLAPPLNTTQSVSVLPSDISFSSTQTNSLRNPSEVPFGFPVTNGGMYYFRIVGFYTVNSTTNGARISLNIPSLGNQIGYYHWINTSASAWSAFYAFTTSVTGLSATTTSASTASNVFIMDGFISAGDDGFVNLTIGCEEASPSTVTLKANNRIFYHRVL